MARDLRVRATIEAKDEASQSVRQVEGAFGRLGSFLKDRFVITLSDVVRVTRTVVNAFVDTIKAAAEEEAAIKGLNAALSSLGPSADRVTQALVAQAQALQQTTAFSDDAIIAGQRIAATFTRSEAQLKAITQAAVDLAASGRIDLQSAFTLLGRAATGATETLGRYGIKVTEGASASEKFAQALTQINTQVGGQAVAQVDTFSGAVAQLANQFGEVQEAFGRTVTESGAVQTALSGLTEFLRSEAGRGAIELFTKGISELIKGLGLLATAIGAIFKGEDVFAALVRANNAFDGLGKSAKSTADKIKESTAAQKAQIEAARLMPDPIRAVEERYASMTQLANEAVAAQQALAASFRDTGDAAEEMASDLEAAEGATQAAASGAEEAFSVVGGIRQVSTRRATAADTPAALLRANIESLRSASGLVSAGTLIRLQRRLAQLEAADFGTADDTRSLP